MKEKRGETKREEAKGIAKRLSEVRREEKKRSGCYHEGSEAKNGRRKNVEAF